MPPRPTSVTVLSIIGIVLAALGTCLVLVSFLPFVQAGDDLTAAMLRHRFYRSYMLTNLMVSAVLVGLLWFGSIGSLNMSRGGRKVLLAYAWSAIVWQVIVLIITLVYVAPLMFKQLVAMKAGAMPAGFEVGYWIGFCIGAMLAFLWGATYPILAVIFFNTVKVKNAFDGVYQMGSSGYPIEVQPPAEDEFERRA